MDDISLTRLYLLRAYYALVGFGAAAVFWPPLLFHTPAWGADNGAQDSLLAALSPMFLLGLRYPIGMLPVLFYEFFWKLLWFVFVAGPLWAGGHMTAGVWSNVFACGIAIVLTPIVAPWRYLWKRYVTAPADRWR